MMTHYLVLRYPINNWPEHNTLIDEEIYLYALSIALLRPSLPTSSRSLENFKPNGPRSCRYAIITDHSLLSLIFFFVLDRLPSETSLRYDLLVVKTSVAPCPDARSERKKEGGLDHGIRYSVLEQRGTFVAKWYSSMTLIKDHNRSGIKTDTKYGKEVGGRCGVSSAAEPAAANTLPAIYL